MTQAAFPSPGVLLPSGRQQGAYEGMSLRDYAALNIDDTDLGAAMDKYLTYAVKTELAGRPCPQPSSEYERGVIGCADEVTHPLDVIAWTCEVRAALRYMMADAMMLQRERM